MDKTVDLGYNQTISAQGQLTWKAIIQEPEIKGGRAMVMFREKGRSRMKPLNILVAQAFLENPEDFRRVININGDPTDNSVENLRWVSYADFHRMTGGLAQAERRIESLQNRLNKALERIAELESSPPPKSAPVREKTIFPTKPKIAPVREKAPAPPKSEPPKPKAARAPINRKSNNVGDRLRVAMVDRDLSKKVYNECEDLLKNHQIKFRLLCKEEEFEEFYNELVAKYER